MEKGSGKVGREFQASLKDHAEFGEGGLGFFF
jgi:hypothetical protein